MPDTSRSILCRFIYTVLKYLSSFYFIFSVIAHRSTLLKSFKSWSCHLFYLLFSQCRFLCKVEKKMTFKFFVFKLMVAFTKCRQNNKQYPVKYRNNSKTLYKILEWLCFSLALKKVSFLIVSSFAVFQIDWSLSPKRMVAAS